MSVGDLADDFMLIRAVGRERFARVVLWSSVKSPSKLELLPVGRRSRVAVTVFHTPAAKCILNRSLVGARHTSPAVV